MRYTVKYLSYIKDAQSHVWYIKDNERKQVWSRSRDWFGLCEDYEFYLTQIMHDALDYPGDQNLSREFDDYFSLYHFLETLNLSKVFWEAFHETFI